MTSLAALLGRIPLPATFSLPHHNFYHQQYVFFFLKCHPSFSLFKWILFPVKLYSTLWILFYIDFPALLPVPVLSQVSLSVACAAIFFLLHLSKFDCCFGHQILIVEVPKYLISTSVLLLTKMLVNLDRIPWCMMPAENCPFP